MFIKNFTKILTKPPKSFWFTVPLMVLISAQVAYASFQLESTGIVLTEREGRISFNIQNTANTPMLLSTKLTDLSDDNLSKQILVAPPITRIDAGQSQQVNFVLKKGTKLNHEVMLKVSFEGIGQSPENSAKMAIRQDVGLMIIPNSVPQTKTPWEDITLKVEAGELIISNSGKHVIRMAPQVTVMPENKIIALPHYYLMPGETQKVKVSKIPDSVQIIPLSRYGFKLKEVTFPLNK